MSGREVAPVHYLGTPPGLALSLLLLAAGLANACAALLAYDASPRARRRERRARRAVLLALLASGVTIVAITGNLSRVYARP